MWTKFGIATANLTKAERIIFQTGSTHRLNTLKIEHQQCLFDYVFTINNQLTN